MYGETAYLVIFSYIGAISLILIGFYALTVHRHVIRMILGLVLLEAGVNLTLITIGYHHKGVAPIITDHASQAVMVDPIPQALVLTAIVIGVGVQALALALAVKVYQTTGTLDVVKLTHRLAEASGTRMIDGSPAPMQEHVIESSSRALKEAP